MSELINARNSETRIRAKFLATVSSIALLGYLGSAATAMASEDGDHPIVWIELGGQLERNGNAPDLFSPAFFNQESPADLAVEGSAQRPPPFSTGFDGKISFTPEGSDWIFSGAICFGKSGTAKHLHHQSPGTPSAFSTLRGHRYDALWQAYADTHSSYRESHAILDFQAGKDIGLGIFGAQGASIFSAGVRFAQFSAASDTTIHALPAYHAHLVKYNPGKYTIHTGARYHYTGMVRTSPRYASRGAVAVMGCFTTGRWKRFGHDVEYRLERRWRCLVWTAACSRASPDSWLLQ